MEVDDSAKFAIAPRIRQARWPRARQSRIACLKQEIEIRRHKSRDTSTRCRQIDQNLMGTKSIARLRTDRFGDCSTNVGDLELAFEQAEDAIGREKSADASDAPHLECPVEQLTGRAFDCSAKDVDDRTAELLEVWQLGLVLRDACAGKEDNVASVASYKKVVGNRRTVNDEAHW